MNRQSLARAAQRYRADAGYRGAVSLGQGMMISGLFAVFKLVTALVYGSYWLLALGVYYGILALARVCLLHCLRRGNACPDPAGKARWDWRGYRMCACLMLPLNIGMTGVVVQMVRDGRGFVYPGYLIYGVAAYAFYALIMTVVTLLRRRGRRSPLLTAAKLVSLCGALMSILALQTALLSRFGADNPAFSRIMTSITGGAVCLISVVLALGMLHTAQAHGKMQKKNGVPL